MKKLIKPFRIDSILELGRAYVPDRGVPWGSMAECLDFFGDFFQNPLSIEPWHSIDRLVLERAKEALRDCVVPTVPASTHTAFGSV